MPLVIAQWPNRTVSVLKASAGWDDIWLFDCLDQEGDPLSAKVYVVSGKNAHIGWSFKSEGGDEDSLVAYCGKAKPWHWPADILRRRYALFAEEFTNLPKPAPETTC